jgi:hypothetical protein
VSRFWPKNNSTKKNSQGHIRLAFLVYQAYHQLSFTSDFNGMLYVWVPLVIRLIRQVLVRRGGFSPQPATQYCVMIVHQRYGDE